jgi:type I restriction-modification system DNA methylase subunit
VIQPKPKETLCDPACGTGGFLLAAHDYVVKHNPNMRSYGVRPESVVIYDFCRGSKKTLELL